MIYRIHTYTQNTNYWAGLNFTENAILNTRRKHRKKFSDFPVRCVVSISPYVKLREIGTPQRLTKFKQGAKLGVVSRLFLCQPV